MQNCKGCCFAEFNDGKQIRCSADKYKYIQLAKPEEIKTTSSGFFELDRLCLYKRSTDWESEKTTEEKIQHARNQLFPNIGICIDDDSENPEDLPNVIDSICNSNYPKERLSIVIYSHFGKKGARIPSLVSKTKSLGVNCSSVFIIENNIYENETSVFNKLAKATFLSRVSSNINIDFGKTFNTINKIFNDELSQKLVFKSGEALFINKTYVSRSYLDYLDYKEMERAIAFKVIDTEYIYNII
jgi:hypothetical protein